MIWRRHFSASGSVSQRLERYGRFSFTANSPVPACARTAAQHPSCTRSWHGSLLGGNFHLDTDPTVEHGHGLLLIARHFGLAPSVGSPLNLRKLLRRLAATSPSRAHTDSRCCPLRTLSTIAAVLQRCGRSRIPRSRPGPLRLSTSQRGALLGSPQFSSGNAQQWSRRGSSLASNTVRNRAPSDPAGPEPSPLHEGMVWDIGQLPNACCLGGTCWLRQVASASWPGPEGRHPEEHSLGRLLSIAIETRYCCW